MTRDLALCQKAKKKGRDVFIAIKERQTAAITPIWILNAYFRLEDTTWVELFFTLCLRAHAHYVCLSWMMANECKQQDFLQKENGVKIVDWRILWTFQRALGLWTWTRHLVYENKKGEERSLMDEEGKRSSSGWRKEDHLVNWEKKVLQWTEQRRSLVDRR